MALGLGMVQRIQRINWPKNNFSLLVGGGNEFPGDLRKTIASTLHVVATFTAYIDGVVMYTETLPFDVPKAGPTEGEHPSSVGYFATWTTGDLAATLKARYGDNPIPDEINIRGVVTIDTGGFVNGEIIVDVSVGKDNQGGAPFWDRFDSIDTGGGNRDATVKLNSKTFKFVT